MQQNKWMLYGANGYTGQLICEEAAARGLQPILAGRNKPAIQALASCYGWEYRIFSLDNIAEVHEQVSDMEVVLHAAGPFSQTAAPMLHACISACTHYLDITGEIEVFEKAAALTAQAVQARVMLMPGVGFDVVPTDCMAALLKEKLPDADTLTLAFGSFGGQLSHGTASTMVQNLGKPGLSRQGGKLLPEPVGRYKLHLHWKDRALFFMSIPWGDVSTAWYTTGIPNIRTYTRTPPLTYRLLRWQWLFNPLLRQPRVKRYLQRKIDKAPAGPGPEKRKKAYSLIYGKASNSNGKTVEANFTCADGYTLTARSAVYMVQQVLQGQYKAGFQTPAGCFGSNLIFQIEGTGEIEWLPLE